MTPAEFARIRELFDRAMALPPGERSQFVESNAAPGVRSELLAMVQAGDDSQFLATAFATGLLDEIRPVADMPSQIGHYKILRELGRGGMGVVYMALRNDDVFNKVVALKVIGAAALDAGASLVARFKQERQILAGLDHPNIARILDGGNTPDGRPFYVMEYVAGSPIDDYCTRMNVDVPTRVRMMAQACDAIEYLHKNAIAHRDVKPHNILVTIDGRVKLVDFGIAKVETVDGMLRSSSSVAGQPTMIMTPGYASPEQITGDSSGKTGDIYSLAVVLYQLLTGRLPYADTQGRPNLEAQLSGKAPEPPSKEFAKTPKPATSMTDLRKVSMPDLDRVVLTALQRDPLQRYPTVQGFSEDLRRCLDGRPIVARRASWTYAVRKLIGRNRVAAALAVVALISVGTGAWFTFSAQIERAQLQAKEEELERFVALLNVKVNRWQEPEDVVPAEEKVADVQAANRVMSSDTVRTLSERAPDPPRVKRLVASLRSVLERADELSQGQPPLRKEIALVFRQIGDFESTAPLAQLTDKQGAERSYRKAAVIAADVRSADGAWADQQLTELSTLLQGLGTTLDVASLEVPAETPEPAPPTPAPAPTRIATAEPTEATEPAPDPVDAEARAALTQRLRTTSIDAERARRSFETLRASLASRGQTIRTDVEASLSEADSLIEDARSLLDANDLTTAEDYLRRAGFQLRKVFQAVGG
jgi:eukaryotic-like serine/threonine-protein kinase